jgi:hypothetical protein
MDAIEKLLDSAGETIAYAQTLDPDGTWRRVHDGNAYKKSDVYARLSVCAEQTFYFVECRAVLINLAGAALRAPPAWIERNSKIIDHHQPGSHGYGKAPKNFLPASSIGQVICELARLGRLANIGHQTRPEYPPLSGWLASIVPAESLERLAHFTALPWPREHHCIGNPGEWVLEGFRGMWKVGEKMTDPNLVAPVGIPHNILLIAACDHCLRAAYAGDCPGVYSLEVLGYRTKLRAAIRKCSEKEVSQDFEKAFKGLNEAPKIVLGNYSFADVRGRELPELADTGTYLNISYLTGPLQDPSGRKKIVWSGDPKEIEGFVGWVRDQRLLDIHVDLSREIVEAFLP